MPAILSPLPRRALLALLLAPFVLVRAAPEGLRADELGPSPSGRGEEEPIPTEETLSQSTLRLPGAIQAKITSRLTLPPGARWESPVPTGSLLLTVEQGALHVSLIDSWARIARAYDPLLHRAILPELVPGAEAALSVGDRLVARGDGAIVARNAGKMVAVVSVVRVGPR